LLGWQDIPAVHDTQLPLLHTRFVPHEVPLATLPDSAQTGTPVLQVVVPVRQGLPETVQAAAAVQLPQTPVALQTLFVPQLVPAATSVLLSLQTGVPVEQASVPLWQALVVGVHGPFCWQLPHAPLLQTMLVPQEVPFGLLPVSVHTPVPVAQTIAPVRHRFVGLQVLPAVHAVHAPLLHTMFVPHEVPLVLVCPVSTHDITPLAEQAVCPM
jgi:hypothetical protein